MRSMKHLLVILLIFLACFSTAFGQYFGLPAIGFVMTEFFNDSVNGFYGNTVPWQYAVDWLQPG